MTDNKIMSEQTFGSVPTLQFMIDDMTYLNEEFLKLTRIIEENVPDSRYRSLAITALEQASMWANKGITRNSDGSSRA